MDNIRAVLEKQVLGCVMWRPEAIRAIDLTTADFCDPVRSKIYETMLALDADGLNIDESTVYARMGANGADICELWTTVPTGSNLGVYLVELKKLIASEKKRAISAESYRMVMEGADALQAAEVLRQKAEEIDRQYSDNRANESEALANAAAAICAAIRDRRPAEDTMFLGVPWLDRLHKGLRPGDYVILAARPSVGKTALTIQILAELARAGKRTLLISKEMEARAIAERIVTYLAMTSASIAARQPDKVPERTRSQILSVTPEINDVCKQIKFVTRNASTPEQIAARIREAKAEGACLVACDYLQLLEAKGNNRNESVSALSRAWKLAIMDAGLPGLMLSQLSRAGEKEGRKPELSDLRDSGSIEQDADLVWFLHRPPEKKTMIPSAGISVEFHQSKGRNTGTGWAPLTFHGDKQRFFEVEMS